MGILSRFKKRSNDLGKGKTAEEQKDSNEATAVSPREASPQPNDVLETSETNETPDGSTSDSPSPVSAYSSPSPLRKSVLNPDHKLKANLTGIDTSHADEIDKDGDVLGLKRNLTEGDAPVKITIMNGKGGSGKSTIATNLATILSTHANSVTIIDNDPQESSIRWLKERPHNSIPIRGVTANKMTRLKNIQLWNSGIGPETKYVIIDTQAGLRGIELSDVIDRSDMIIIPVLPSAIDMRATADFVAQVFLSKAYRRTRKPIGVVANRVINDSVIYRKLQKFLLSLRMNFISTFSDNRAYLVAAEKGMGIFETNEPDTEGEKTEWDLLGGWVEDKRKAVAGVSRG